MSVKISELVELNTGRGAAGGYIPVVATNVATNSYTTYQMSIANLKAYLSQGDFNITGNVVVSGSLQATDVNTATQSTVTSAGNFVDIQTDGNLTYPTAVSQNNDVGLRFFYYKGTDANTAANSAALIWDHDTGFLTWYGGGAGNAVGVLSGAEELGTMQVGGFIISNTTISTSTATGALRIGGGAGILGNINVGGAANIAGNVLASSLTANTVVANVSVSAGSVYASQQITGNILTVNTTATISGNLTTRTIIPTANNTSQIGASDLYYSQIYSNIATVNSITANDGVYTNITSNLLLSNSISTPNSITANAITSNLTLTANAVTAVSMAVTGNASADLITATNVTASTMLTVPAITKSGTTGTGNIGSSTNTFNTIFARATSAQYADLAEKYLADADYDTGTVVIFGGEQEITTTSIMADVSVAGVISQEPAYLMNSESTGLAVALRGKVPVKVLGSVKKGDLLITASTPGHAQAVNSLTTYNSIAVFAKSLETNTDPGAKMVMAVII